LITGWRRGTWIGPDRLSLDRVTKWFLRRHTFDLSEPKISNAQKARQNSSTASSTQFLLTCWKDKDKPFLALQYS
jgi:hypothetical protein